MVYLSLYTGTTRGSSGLNETRWWELDVPCVRCQGRVTYKSGIICANYGATRGHFQPCRNAWCAECFKPSPLDPCIIKIPEDFVGATVDEVGAEGRFMVARPGDHLCASFQCPNCQSQNIRGKDLVTSTNIADACFESLCIRAQLDSFWARSKETVKGHVREAR